MMLRAAIARWIALACKKIPLRATQGRLAACGIMQTARPRKRGRWCYCTKKVKKNKDVQVKRVPAGRHVGRLFGSRRHAYTCHMYINQTLVLVFASPWVSLSQKCPLQQGSSLDFCLHTRLSLRIILQAVLLTNTTNKWSTLLRTAVLLQVFGEAKVLNF